MVIGGLVDWWIGGLVDWWIGYWWIGGLVDWLLVGSVQKSVLRVFKNLCQLQFHPLPLKVSSFE